MLIRTYKLQRRSFLRYEKSGHIGVLKFQKLHLFVDSAGVSGETTVRADHTVAGNDDGNFVVPDGTADRLRGYPTAALRFQPTGNVPICYDLSPGNVEQNAPDGKTEWGADRR